MFHVLLHRSERKEALLKQKEKEKINERRKEELKRAEKKDKDKQAISEYEKWLVGVDVGKRVLFSHCSVKGVNIVVGRYNICSLLDM